ncbi:MAG: hypothetical protein ACOY3P_16135 [Planctomycetota bacterium]
MTRSIGFAVIGILAVWLTCQQMRHTQMLVERRVSLDRYLEGTSHRPFCHRVLVPVLLRVITPVLPTSACAAWGRELSPADVPTDVAADDPRVYVALFLVLLTPLLVYAGVSGAMYQRFFSHSVYAFPIGAIGVLLFLAPMVLQGIGHVYDFSVLAFHAGMLLCLVEKRLGWYLALFVVSCFNKETTVLMTVAYCACLFDRVPRRQFLLYLLLQVVAFVAVYGIVTWHFRGNPGAGMEVHLSRLIPIYSQRWKTLVYICAIVVLVAYRWSEKPQFFRRAMFMLVPHVALCLYGAYPGELRNFYESVPLLALFSVRSVELAASRFGAWTMRPRLK